MTMQRVIFMMLAFYGGLGASVVCAEEVRYTGGAFRDPFAGQLAGKPVSDAFQTDPQLSSMFVEGVLLSGDNSRAIIGGSIYHVGSTLGSGKISRIDKEGVTVIVNGNEFVIKQKTRTSAYEIPKSAQQ